MYIYETHMHTSEASDCAECTAVQMADKYKSEGYTGIIITDHFSTETAPYPMICRGKSVWSFTARATSTPRQGATR